MQKFFNFLKDITTLRTVWIDKGQGKWIVKKRMHPFLRGVFFVMAVTVGAGAYMNFSAMNELHKANAQPDPIITEKKELPEPEKIAAIPVTIPVNNNDSEPEELQQETPLNESKIAEKPEILQAPTANMKGDIFERPDKLLPSNNNKFRIEISKSKYELNLYEGKELIKTYRIAVGKNPGDKLRVGDHRTPVGRFKIVSIEPSSTWKHDFGDGKGKIAGAYGPWFLRLDAKGWKGIGIHGTHDPDSRGTMATEGCIRLSNEDISELRQYAYRNMPVTIREN